MDYSNHLWFMKQMDFRVVHSSLLHLSHQQNCIQMLDRQDLTRERYLSAKDRIN